MLPLYAHYHVLPLDYLTMLSRVTYMYSHTNNLLPTVFDSYFERPAHNHNTRFSKTNIVIPKHKSKFSGQSIKLIGPKLWAEVPPEAKMLPFPKSFTAHMKKTYIGTLPTDLSSGNHIPKPSDSQSKNYKELKALFLEDDVDTEFFGFDLSLQQIFLSDDSSENDFLGF